MAKQGMKRPSVTHTKPKNELPPVPEIQGKAKSGKEKAKPIIAGTDSSNQKVYHSKPKEKENPYSVFDTSLAEDNLENNLPKADLQDL
ncbi:MAG: hypothetical protein ACI3XA_08120 [Clostridia bacterium]